MLRGITLVLALAARVAVPTGAAFNRGDVRTVDRLFGAIGVFR